MGSNLKEIVKLQSNKFKDDNALARYYAINKAVNFNNLISATVSFKSDGYAVVVGKKEDVLIFFKKIPNHLKEKVVLLFLDKNKRDKKKITKSNKKEYYANEIYISGYLGYFDVRINILGELRNLAELSLTHSYFDLVIDLSSDCVCDSQIVPLGFYAVGSGLVSEKEAINALQEMIGIFDKPKYFQFSASLCAHSVSKLDGCTRCLDSCDTGALSISDNTVSINPYLCQGIGSCSTACPTEAISYSLFDSEHLQKYIRQLLEFYREKGGASPIILFYSRSDASEFLAKLPFLNNNILPIELEELPSIGIDTWFCSLVYGAAQIILLEISPILDKSRQILQKELSITEVFLENLNLPKNLISLIKLESLNESHLLSKVIFEHEDILKGSKRDKLSDSLDILAKKNELNSQMSEVPFDAPYGAISIRSNDCTLCLSCVSACPTKALEAVGSYPAISFREQDCVQCGLCQMACPESVISLVPRYNWNSSSRKEKIIMHEEDAAECLSCGKPFAPASMVAMLIEKLQNHSHFKNQAIKRLSMCEDCRVKDIFDDFIQQPEKQLKQ